MTKGKAFRSESLLLVVVFTNSTFVVCRDSIRTFFTLIVLLFVHLLINYVIFTLKKFVLNI